MLAVLAMIGLTVSMPVTIIGGLYALAWIQERVA